MTKTVVERGIVAGHNQSDLAAVLRSCMRVAEKQSRLSP